ncbi:hypothetical protein PV11_00363 [Exophiala sideris]|uniref:Cytochrome P450 n=1 Tax=Exophiala sideris TaxID=1016849 RepID=A0A0D1X9T0_9EURO|nr:hypothetical protein PV11_00363 [Exophiala sideris]
MGLLLLGGVCVLAYVLYRFLLFPAFISPLAKVPTAHWTCSVSSLWILYKRLKAEQNTTVLAAHRKHGDVVRLGPTELSVNCVENGYKTVYSGPFDKDDYYRFFDNFGVQCMFSTPKSQPHSALRRFISQIYSKTNIHHSPVIAAQSRIILYHRFLPLLDGFATSPPPGGVDIYSLFQAFGFDTVSAFYLGMQCSTNFLQDTRMRERWRERFLARAPYAACFHELPNMVWLLRTLGVRIMPKEVEEGAVVLDDMVRQWYQRTLRFMSSNTLGRYENPEDVPLALSAILSGWRKEQESENSKIEPQKLHDPEPFILSELADNLAAGYETTGITMTYISWHLAREPELQEKIREELRTLRPALFYPQRMVDGESCEHILPDAKALDTLPLVDAVIKETLRLHGAVPGGQPRVVPKSGCQIGLYKNIPRGTRVASSAYVLHRNPAIFPQPEHWDPCRWLDDDVEGAKARDQWFWAFSSGPRTCVGKNFAFHELKTMMAAVLTNYKVHVVSDDGIEQQDGHTKGPKANAIYLGFSRVDC